MVKVQISYNPYTVNTDLWLNGKMIEKSVSPLAYVSNKRLQEWIEPKGSWPGVFKALRTCTGEHQIQIEFIGTFGDFEDLTYAKDKFGNCFKTITLIHKNKKTAKDADPYQKMLKLKDLYLKLQEGPVEELKTPDIQENFNAAINSDFKIVIVAPMSSGKSTLINSIIGRDLLPAVNQATTAVITTIKDNDQYNDFHVTAADKYGNIVANNEIASPERISELNFMKDPNDHENKEALIHLIQLEGPIPNLPSDMLNTVFVDTPGGNNSQNAEHERMMDEAINDENKSLILYVFNGAQLGTNDSNLILKKIANAMQNNTNGKQSRDRFLFVANRMDEFDVAKEPYEEVIENTILPQLASNGITEPNLFLASAQTAKLIRKTANKEKLSETEEDNLETLVKRFNRSTRILPKYASLNSSDRNELIALAEEYAAAGENANTLKETIKNKYKAAEINSGIPAIELAIKEYLEKYAIAIKIKTAHDTFMKKVIERNMVNNCEAEWSKSQESFAAVKKELQEKRAKCDHNEKLLEFRAKVDSISFDDKHLNAEQKNVTDELDHLVEKASTESTITQEKAEFFLSSFNHALENIEKDALVLVDNALNNGIRRSCQLIVEEYTEYIRELDSFGSFNIGGYDIKQTKGFDAFNLFKADDLLHDEKYITEKDVITGTETRRKKGFFASIARMFGGGYETVDIYEKQKLVNFQEFVMDQVSEIQLSFSNMIQEAILDTNKKVEYLKSATVSKLEGLDKMVSTLMEEIDNMLVSQETLQAKVETNAKKARWIKDFVKQVEDLLNV